MPSYFQYIVDVMILFGVVCVAIVIALWKRIQYDRQTEGYIKAVIRLPSGHDMFYVQECKDDAEWLEINDFTYKLNPDKKRWSKHPSRPFLGLKFLQSNIRTETWDLNNPNPVIAPVGNDAVLLDKETGVPLYPVVSSKQIYAYSNAKEATKLIAEQQELIESNQLVKKSFANQPNKTWVYAGIGITLVLSIATLVVVVQIGGIV